MRGSRNRNGHTTRNHAYGVDPHMAVLLFG
jgi:hypothetical protein